MTEKYEKAFEELARVVCHSEHTYLYTQTLLRVMSQEVSYNKKLLRCSSFVVKFIPVLRTQGQFIF